MKTFYTYAHVIMVRDKLSEKIELAKGYDKV